MADHVLSAQLENLEEQHFEILHFCLHNEQDSLNMDMQSWFKIFAKLKEYLFVAICDPDLYQDAIKILTMFFTAE